MNGLFSHREGTVEPLGKSANHAVAAKSERSRKTPVRKGGHGLLKRTSISAAFCAGLLLGAGIHHASAQGSDQRFPSKPVRLIVSSGGSDAFARPFAAKMGEAWDQAVITDIRPGASGLIAMETLSQSAPDGYTLGVVTLSQMLSTLHHQRHLLSSEYAAVTFAGSTPFVIAISTTIPAKTLDEWIAYVKAQPGKIAYGSSGLWASAHVCMEAFNDRAGLSMLHVPYKTSTAAAVALASGEVKAYCTAAVNAVALTKAGKIRPLGSTYKEPSDLAPGVPPIADKLPGFEVQGWYGIVAPLQTPKNTVSRISADSAKVLKTSEMQKTYGNVGIRTEGTTPEAFAAFLKAESDRWGKVSKAGSAKP